MRMDGSVARFCAAALVVALVSLVSGCTFVIEPPGITISPLPGYPRGDVLIPYEVRGNAGSVTAAWELRRYDGGLGEWRDPETWQFPVEAGTSGVLPLELGWGNARYEISGQILANRGGASGSPATLTAAAEFYVDVDAPFDSIDLNDSQGGGPNPLGSYVPGIPLLVTPDYLGSPDPDYESAVNLHYRVDSTSLPTVNDPILAPGESVELWPGDGAPYTRFLSIIAIDEAGNRGTLRLEAYRAP